MFYFSLHARGEIGKNIMAASICTKFRFFSVVKETSLSGPQAALHHAPAAVAVAASEQMSSHALVPACLEKCLSLALPSLG